ncbi:hypothetical protein AYI68_g4864 [Smittium mucronatum]|uniref:Uncharacterized protein n=1 Tax=Smittium mucronatum TaxID=133383 RepID=A0A1R0GW12_9FUNG|nr:hypothetical protein AYI68_g4864 [Smittium mucronatum]
MDVLAASKSISNLGFGLGISNFSKSSGSRWNQNSVGRMINKTFYAEFNSKPNSCLADSKLDLSDHMLISIV